MLGLGLFFVSKRGPCKMVSITIASQDMYVTNVFQIWITAPLWGTKRSTVVPATKVWLCCKRFSVMTDHEYVIQPARTACTPPTAIIVIENPNYRY